MNKNNELKYIAYTRKSTVGEDRQMLSHEDQEKDLLKIENNEKLNVVLRYTGKEIIENPFKIACEIFGYIGTESAEELYSWFQEYK